MQDDSPVYVPLVCPLSGTKIRNPVRAPGSNTYACFDKESFALSGRYTCPLTGVYCLVTEIQRDEAMAAILAATPDDATFALVNATVSLETPPLKNNSFQESDMDDCDRVNHLILCLYDVAS